VGEYIFERYETSKSKGFKTGKTAKLRKDWKAGARKYCLRELQKELKRTNINIKVVGASRTYLKTKKLENVALIDMTTR